jgi:hypothetical protein
MRIALLLLLLVHGLIHLMGFAKAFGYAELAELKLPISRPVGLLWLVSTLLFVTAAALLLFKSEWWWLPAAPALLLSQGLILAAWRDAKFGTFANLLLVLPVVAGLMEARPTSYRHAYRRAVDEGLARHATLPVVTEADLARLPALVQRYLLRAGVAGKPRVRWVRAVFKGGIRMGQDKPWMDFESEQYNFFDQPTRAFYIRATMYGLPVDGLHLFRGPAAVMQIKVASLLQVVDGRGPQMNQGETVTLFNDMCVLAPATLIDPAIRWEPDGPLSVIGHFTNQGITISARLTFDESGDLVDFLSNDRFQSADGKTYNAYPWSTPLRDFKDFEGRRLPTYGEALWHAPEGAFAYGRFHLQEIQYNE